MTTYEEMETVLDKMVSELPMDLFRELNGGVILLPDIKMHEESTRRDNLFILGEYHYDPRGLGRYITIYYGSFMQLYARLAPERQEDKLRRVLYHEFTHHLESLAGERDLEIQDARELLEFKSRRRHDQ